MNDLPLSFIQHFNVLKTSIDPNEIHASDQAIQALSLKEEAIPSLIFIIQNNEVEYYRFQAVLCLKLAFRGLITSGRTPNELIHVLLDTLAKEPNATIRSNFVHFIGRSLLNESNHPLTISFAQAALESQNPLQIHSAIQLLNSVVGTFQNNDQELTRFMSNLAMAGMSLNIIDITLDSLEFIFGFFNNHYQLSDDITQPFWQAAMSLFEPTFKTPDKFWELSAIVGDTIEENAPYADISVLLPLCVQFISQNELEHDVQAGVVYIIDAITANHPEALIQTNSIIPIFQRYVHFALKDYSPNEPIDSFDSVIMRNICETYNKDLNILNAIWQLIPNLAQSPSGMYVAMLILSFSFNRDCEYFYEIFDDVIQILTQGLMSQSIATSEAALLCLEAFFNAYGDDLDDYIEDFENLLINVIKTRPSVAFIKTFTIILKYGESTDNIFEAIFPFLIELVQRSDVEGNLSILGCLAVLVQHSSVAVLDHIPIILQLMQNILTSQTPDALLMKGEAVDCLHSLLRASPEQFSVCLDTFVPFVVQSLSNGADPQLACSCVNCLGTLVIEFTDIIRPIIPQVLPLMADLAMRDGTKQLEQLAELERQNCTPEDIDEFDMSNLVSSDALEMAGGAFLVYATIIAKYPQELLPEWFQKTTEIAVMLAGSAFSFSISASCRGLYFIAEAIHETGFRDDANFERLFTNMIIVIEKADTVEIIGDALQTVAALVHSCGLSTLGSCASSLPELIGALLTKSHQVFQDQTETEAGIQSNENNDKSNDSNNRSSIKFPRDLYRPIICLFFALFDTLSKVDCEGFMVNLLPIVLKYAQSSSKHERAFALDILLNFAEHGYNPSNDFYSSLFNLAVDCVGNDFDQGLYAIKQMCTFAPVIVKQFSQNLLQMFANILTPQKKQRKRSSSSKNRQSMIDNCVSALGEFAMKVAGESEFPLQEFASLALANMPPKNDIEEAPSDYNFLLWMIPLAHNALNNEMIGALARLLCLPPSTLNAMTFTQESLETYKKVLSQLIRITQNGQDTAARAVRNDPTKMRLLQQMMNT